ncbi:MAG: glycerophosphodiester phosphodiesterase family protein [Tannerella sp.]|jgi:glycerophosphoryl diester phosphodiesterase|nr:glycerophosphodiester phosphodiesterase family protein [Tannerella sp.]
MKYFLIFFALFLFGCNVTAKDNYIAIKTTDEASAFFSYKGDGSIIISGHRGGREAGSPENSIEGLQNVINQTPSIFEIDPRLTKDSVIVLMHDATLERTTTGKGKVGDYTYKELQALFLKDYSGNVTKCKIPTLEEVIIATKGKTVVNLDKKDVPLEMIVALIRKLDASSWVMITVHTGAQARYYYDRLPGIMMSAFSRNDKEFEDLTYSGVPWKQMIAYVGPTIDDKNRHIVAKLHALGVRCMVSFAPTHDTLATPAERAEAYKKEISLNPDIIESDIPTEIARVILNLE